MKEKSFEELALKWLGEKKNFVKESTYANYVIAMKNHLIPQMEECKVEEITRERVQEMIVYLRKEGRRDGRGGLSDKTVRDIVTILKLCLKESGQENGWVYKKNVLQFPIDERIHTMQTMDEDMYEQMLRAIQKERSCEALGYAVSLYTGMRIGEVCALQWKDIDMRQGKIYVTKTLQRVYYKEQERGRTEVIISTPKSRASIREIPISRALRALLAFGICPGECYLLSGAEKYVEPRLYRKHYMNFLERNQLRYIKFHGLRHTFATRCIEKGADYKTVSCILGHSSVNLTLNRYVHPCPEQKRMCVELASISEYGKNGPVYLTLEK